ncbi:MAG: septum site-determining protein MinC [Burkholderiales bacterium]|nr:septum site-determining protein MinC [Burkholderiales bacterium]
MDHGCSLVRRRLACCRTPAATGLLRGAAKIRRFSEGTLLIATFEIKSAQLPLVALLLKTADLEALAQDMQARFGDMPEFFDHDPLVIDLSQLGEAVPEFGALLTLLKRHKVLPVAVKGGSQEQMQAAMAAGLANGEDARMAAWIAARNDKAEPPKNALVVEKPLRSGQQVYAKGRDLVVLSMVNAGAEVIADGSIHVYAPLRGKAIAGAKGNEEARILTTCLEAELVSIAGVYRTSEVPLPPELRGRGAQVRLVDDRLHMNALT